MVDAANIGSGVEKYSRVVGLGVSVVVVVIIIGRLRITKREKKNSILQFCHRS